MRKKSLVVVGMGNLHSVIRALEYVCTDKICITLSHDPKQIEEADALVFPGQGAAASCMQNLSQYPGLTAKITKAYQEKPFLGICMGMQVLMTQSEENNGTACLNSVAGTVKPFALESSNPTRELPLKVPHMGWNTIEQTKDHPLWHDIPNHSHFYFVHSYYCECEDNSLVAGSTHYGHAFASVIAHNNWFAIQAHPEKSSDVGLQLLKNFVQMI